jgi:Transposase DDE domain
MLDCYSLTSSAMESAAGGTVRPSTLAVLLLIIALLLPASVLDSLLHSIARKFLPDVGPDRLSRHNIGVAADVVAFLLFCEAATVKRSRLLWIELEHGVVVRDCLVKFAELQIRETAAAERGTKPVIPNRGNRKQPFSFSTRLYKLRWRIESAFNRLKDFRRIATRYDRLGRNYLSSVCLVASLVWWI